MVLKADQLRVKTLLAETITLLCKNGLNFKTKFSIEGLIGITLDDEDVFLININETIKAAESVQEINDGNNTLEQLPANAKRARNKAAGVANKASSRLSESPASPTVKSLNTNSSIPNIPSGSCARTLRSNSHASSFSDAVKTSRPSRVPRTAKASPTIGAYSGSNDSAAEFGNDSHPASSVGLSECESQTFPSATFKTDKTAGDEDYDDNKFQQTEVDLPEQPSKRVRLELSDVVTESSMRVPSSNEINTAFTTPKDPTKSEPLDIIEIKEESLSDNESQQPSYSAYEDYNSAISYGSANAELMQGFVDSSMFQSGSSFFVPQDGEGSNNPDTSASIGRHQPFNVQTSGILQASASDGPFAEQSSCCETDYAGILDAAAAAARNASSKFPFSCELCGKCITSKDGLRCHLFNWHNMPKSIKCQHCGEAFGYRRALSRHVLSCHSGIAN